VVAVLVDILARVVLADIILLNQVVVLAVAAVAAVLAQIKQVLAEAVA
jgi:hypothetical protein